MTAPADEEVSAAEPEGPRGPEGGPAVLTKAQRVEHYLMYAVVTALLGAAAWFLWHTVSRSEDLFTKGIAIAQAAEGTNPVLMTNRVFVLATAHQVATFKSSALFIGAIICVLGGLFVLRNARASFDASASGGSWSGSLKTTSPGLVMVTLGCLLVATTIMSKVHVPDPLAQRFGDGGSGIDYLTQAQAFQAAAERYKTQGQAETKETGPADFADAARKFREAAETHAQGSHEDDANATRAEEGER